MESDFLEYFYHDVLIEKIDFKFNVSPKGTNCISFYLSLHEENSRVECIFENVFYSSFSMYHNFLGKVYISLAEVDNSDSILLNYKKEAPSYLQEYLSAISCYCIYTTNGGSLKILSSKDVSVNLIEKLNLEK